jgi:hypothetical protein
MYSVARHQTSVVGQNNASNHGVTQIPLPGLSFERDAIRSPACSTAAVTSLSSACVNIDGRWPAAMNP